MCKFTVTRQNQWTEGTLCVEINQGSLDYANPGMYSVKYSRLGEGDTFTGMKPAIEAGIAVYKAWKADSPDKEIGIAVGNTHGMTMPFDGEELTPEVESALLARAEEHDSELDKCERCGEILGKERYGYDGEYNFCSEFCAEEDHHLQQELLAEEIGEVD